jgi:hypothetical protein
VANPFDRTVLLSVTVKVLGISRKVSTDAVEVDADKDLLRVSKRILECEEYAAVGTIVTEMKKYIKNRSVPGAKFIKSGIYAIPLVNIQDVDAKVAEYVSQFNGSVARFCEVYEAKAEQCRERLKSLGEAADYPSIKKVRQSFGIATEYITLGPPSSLEGISKELWDRESKKIQASCQDAAGQVRDAMRAMFADLVGHMVERLEPDAEGKQKTFKASMVKNFKDFIDSFADRNITDDSELSSLVEQAQSILAGKSAEELRKDKDLRSLVTERMTEVKKSLDAMVTDKPRRAILVED